MLQTKINNTICCFVCLYQNRMGMMRVWTWRGQRERKRWSNRMRSQQRKRNQGRLRDPWNNSGMWPLPFPESLTQTQGPQDYPVLNPSSPIQKRGGWSNINTSNSTHVLSTQTFVPLRICLQRLVPKATQSAMQDSEAVLLVPDAYLSSASSLMPDNRFTLWLSENCFSSSCRQVCKDVGRVEGPIICDSSMLNLCSHTNTSTDTNHLAWKCLLCRHFIVTQHTDKNTAGKSSAHILILYSLHIWHFKFF